MVTLEFVEADYGGSESGMGAEVTVGSNRIFASEVLVRITPLLYSDLEQMGRPRPVGSPAPASG